MCDAGGATSVFVFKTSVESHIGEVNFFKVMSGEIKEGVDLINNTTRNKERFSQSKRIVIHGREVTKEISSTDPCILRLEVRHDGDLWVLHSRSTREQPEGIFQPWDVFSPEGAFVRQVAVACAGNPRTDRLVFLDDQRAVLLEGFEAATLAIAGGAAEGEEDEDVAIAVAMYRVLW